MAEQELNLLQLTAGRPAQPRACSAQIMWREPLIAGPRHEFLHYVPNQLLGNSVASRPARAAHLSEKLACLNARRNSPAA
jgi:hypothetical protein